MRRGKIALIGACIAVLVGAGSFGTSYYLTSSNTSGATQSSNIQSNKKVSNSTNNFEQVNTSKETTQQISNVTNNAKQSSNVTSTVKQTEQTPTVSNTSNTVTKSSVKESKSSTTFDKYLNDPYAPSNGSTIYHKAYDPYATPNGSKSPFVIKDKDYQFIGLMGWVCNQGGLPLNVYNGIGNGAELLGRLNENTPVFIIQQYKWYYTINYNGHLGYVQASHIAFVDPTNLQGSVANFSSLDVTGECIVNYANVYKNLDNPTIYEFGIGKGETVMIVGQTPDYYLIWFSYPNEYGFVSKSDMTIISEPQK